MLLELTNVKLPLVDVIVLLEIEDDTNTEPKLTPSLALIALAVIIPS